MGYHRYRKNMKYFPNGKYEKKIYFTNTDNCQKPKFDKRFN